MANENQHHSEDTPGLDIIPLTKGTSISLAGLSSQQKEEFKGEHVKSILTLKAKAENLAIEAQATKANFDILSNTVAKANEDGAAITITRTQTDSLGRTEVIMGNTETAAKGKLNRSQSGQSDLTLAYVIIGAILIIVVAWILK